MFLSETEGAFEVNPGLLAKLDDQLTEELELTRFLTLPRAEMNETGRAMMRPLALLIADRSMGN